MNTDAGAATAAAPDWFRVVVWDSLLGALSQLLPVPVVDDVALGRIRRQMIDRVCRREGLVPRPPQVRRLAGERGVSISRLAGAAVLYPVKKVFKKVFYVLSIRDAVRVFSALFHRGYLLHAALRAGALGPAGEPGDHDVERVRRAIEETLDAIDTRPVRRLVVGTFRASGGLVAGSVGWLASRLRRRGVEELAAEGESPATLSADSPAAGGLLDRLLRELWGEESYRQDLERELERRLAALA